jgi:hypothetical protein
MTILDRDQLLALFDAMHITKWKIKGANAHVNVLFGSPILAELYAALADELQAIQSDSPEEIERWKTWRSLESHPQEMQTVSEYISKSGPVWNDRSNDERVAHVRAMISPFHASEITLARLAHMKSS